MQLPGVLPVSSAGLNDSFLLQEIKIYFPHSIRLGLGTAMPSCMSVTAMSTNVSFTVVSCSPSSFAACTDSLLVIVSHNELLSCVSSKY